MPLDVATLTPLCGSELARAAYDAPDELVRRHAGLPAGSEADPRWDALIAGARVWFRDHGRPWAAMRTVEVVRTEGAVIHLAGGVTLASELVASGLRRAGATSVAIVALTAGEEVILRIADHWREGRPDEAMFTNAVAVAAVEHMRAVAAERLALEAPRRRQIVLPHYSPGYDGWALADQAPLLSAAIDAEGGAPISVLPSGALAPAKSTLALYGIAPANSAVGDLTHFWVRQSLASNGAGTPCKPAYAFAEKTLALWRKKRLRLIETDDQIAATFRMDGSTCTSSGVPLAFDYHVALRREAEGTLHIAGVDCRPADDQPGYQSTCAYLDNAARFMAELAAYRPLVGSTLDEALLWNPSVSPAGCLCSRASQDHKWRAVFHAIHYALNCHE